MKKLITIFISMAMIFALCLGVTAQNALDVTKGPKGELPAKILPAPVYSPNASLKDAPVILQGEPQQPMRGTFFEDVESHVNFTINSTTNGWSYIDGDGSGTYGFSGISFPGSSSPMAYIVFNPKMTNPEMYTTTPGIAPHSGDKFFGCFAASSAVNNDWIISPQLDGAVSISFWAKTYMDDYGLERFKVGVSSTGTAQSNFTFITPAPYVSVPNTWTFYQYTLPAGTQYVAINCVSDDDFIFMLDDITIEYGGTICEPITNLNVNASGNNVNLTWTAAPGTPTGYEIKRDASVIATVTTTSYTDVNVATGEHNYCVSAIFADGCLPQSVCKSVMVGDMCTLRFALIDSYGDGWNGASIGVTVDGVSFGTVTQTAPFPAGGVAQIKDVLLPAGQVKLTWTKGSYDSECSFMVYSTCGDLVYSNAALSSVSTGTLLFTYQHSCFPCGAVQGLTVNMTDNCDAKLNFYGSDPWIIKQCKGDDIPGRVGYSATTGEDMTAAIRFTPADLAALGVLDGQTIPKIALGLGEDLGYVNFMEIRIWEGGTSVADAGVLKYTQTLTGYKTLTPSTFHEYELNTPYIIDATKELRIGYRLINTQGYPFGRDGGPNVVGKGLLFQCPALQSGNFFDAGPAYGWAYNWSIKAFVDMDIEPLLVNIYRDGALIADEFYGNTYLDERAGNFDVMLPHTWTVQKVCDEGGESCPKTVSAGACATDFEAECNTDAVNIQLGTAANNYTIPVNNYYNRSYTQQIYDAAEIGLPVGSLIGNVSFQVMGGNTYTKANQTIYLANTTKSTFTGSTDYIPSNQLQLVYTGSITFSQTLGWNTVYFDTPFTYTGNNIVLVCVNNAGNYPGTAATFRTGNTSSTKVTALYTDAVTTLAPGSLPSTSVTTYAYRNYARFGTCNKFFYLNPNNVYETGAVVTVTSAPYPVPQGQDLTVDISCNDNCYFITEVLIDGQSQIPIPTSYTFYDVQESLPVIIVKTEKYTYPIYSSAGANGTITPEGVIDVNCGDDQQFTIKPDLGYVVEFLLVDGILTPKTSSYTFMNVMERHSIDVTFKVAPYNIVFTHAGNGEVIPVGREDEIPNGQIGMDDGDMQLFVFTPDPFYEIQAVYIDGTPNMGALISGSYLFSNVHESHTLHVIFKLVDRTIVATAGPHGTITPAGNILVPYGSDKSFTISANTGYVIDQILVDFDALDIDDQLSVFVYPFSDVTENHTIYATFKTATMKIEVINGAPCGTSGISPSGDEFGYVYVPYNGTQTFTFAPSEGCKVVEVLIDGIPFPNAIPLGFYTFTYSTGSHSIEVKFDAITYPVKSAISGHGVITPNGTTNVPHGTNINYTWYTFPGYEVVNVFVDGLDYPDAVAAGEYTFLNVKASHNIDVITAPIVYKITAIAETGGFITPSGDISVGYNQNQAFTIKAATGFKINQVLIDGIINAQAATNGYHAFLNVKENHEIIVSFEKSRYNLEATVFGNGMIEPAGIIEVTYFDETTYTITPTTGYQISYVLVNGENKGAINTFTFTEVESNGNIEAFFSPVSVDEYNMGITIYSNANTVYVNNINLIPVTNVSVTDMYGRVVWNGNIFEAHNSITLNVANGIYSVRVTTEDGNFTTTKVNIQQ
jgi:hypothetical protein